MPTLSVLMYKHLNVLKSNIPWKKSQAETINSPGTRQDQMGVQDGEEARDSEWE